MRNNIVSSVIAALIVISCAALSTAQWTPDPFCPFPSDHVTRYPYYGNCSIYWECYNGAKYVMECPEGLEFNAPYQRCDAPELAHCDPFASTTANPNPPTYTTGPTDRTTNRPGPTCPFPSEELIYFPYPGDCTKYWECFEGNSYLYNCPSGLWWHEEISECDYPGSFCDNSTTVRPPTTRSTTDAPTKPPPTTGPVPSCPSEPTEEPIYYPYYGDCTKYWECSDGKEYLYDCPEGLWWHQSISRCDYPGSFCDNSTSPAPTTVITTTYIPPTTQLPYPDCPSVPTADPIYFPYPGDCTKYYECSDGDKYLYTCPSGLWWHQGIGRCDYPGDYCNNTWYDCSEGQTYFPYPGDCAKYYECSNGLKYLYICPGGLWWHQELSECDYPGAYCDNSTTIQPPTSVGPTAGPGPVCPWPPTTDPVYFPYSADCGKYWECSDGKEYLYDCPEGLWWHQSISQCDYPGPFCNSSTTWKPTTVEPTTKTPFICNGTDTSYWPDPDNNCHKYIECLHGRPYEVDCPPELYFSDKVKECVKSEDSECCQTYECKS